MKAPSSKTVTLTDILKAVKDVKHDIKFLREDSVDMEEHINKKILLSEQRLSQKIAEEGSRLENKLGEKIGERVEDLEQIHPNHKHVFPSTASI